jgi:hypothetical protein
MHTPILKRGATISQTTPHEPFRQRRHPSDEPLGRAGELSEIAAEVHD